MRASVSRGRPRQERIDLPVEEAVKDVSEGEPPNTHSRHVINLELISLVLMPVHYNGGGS